jgi:CubicO group peptidase (beta-lactamase class C family)
MKRLAFLACLFVSQAAFAAPDEDLLGKAQDYPVCNVEGPLRPGCLVGALSHYDQLFPARPVPKGATVRELRRAANEPPIMYRRLGSPEAPKSVNDFMAENRNTGLLVLKDDQILVERYQYGRKDTDRFQSYSMAKTVVAMLVGVALSEQKIRNIDDLAQDYLPELKGHPYGETSLRNLLTMSSGVRFIEDYSGKDDSMILGMKTIAQVGPGGADSVATFRTREVPAGTRWHYASGESEVLALVLRAAVKQPLVQYLSEKIWQPMGAEADATWQVDASGNETGFMGINATLRDWGRFGLVLANDGRVGERQLIPAAWVKAATTPQAPYLRVGVATPNNGYGYQTWLIHPKERYFAALGLRGQAIFVDPRSKIVEVHTAVYDLDGSRNAQFALFYGTLRSLGEHISNP